MKTLLSLVLTVFSFSTFAQTENLVCTTQEGSKFVMYGKSTNGLQMRISRDTYEGSLFPAEKSRSDNQSVEIHLVSTNGCWIGRNFNANLLFKGSDFNTAFGWYELVDQKGNILQDGLVQCQSTLPIGQLLQP
jgi:hypothetical protein